LVSSLLAISPENKPLFSAFAPHDPERNPPVASTLDTACYDADLLIYRQRRVPGRGTTRRLQAADVLRRLAGVRVSGATGHMIYQQTFRFLTVLQLPFLELPTVGIHKRNLLKAPGSEAAAGSFLLGQLHVWQPIL
jgi:hypothetical protein